MDGEQISCMTEGSINMEPGGTASHLLILVCACKGKNNNKCREGVLLTNLDVICLLMNLLIDMIEVSLARAIST